MFNKYKIQRELNVHFLGDKALGHRGQSWTSAYFNLVIFTPAILD